MIFSLRPTQNSGHLLKNPLLWRIGLWTFISVIAIEATVLSPLIAGFMTQMILVALLATLSTMVSLSSMMLMLTQQIECSSGDRYLPEHILHFRGAQVRQPLTIEIDSSKRAEDVAKIIEAESFQRVKHKLQHLRQA